MDVDKKYLVPTEMISCPLCGRRYGHHRTKVCTSCQECSACHKERGWDFPCADGDALSADEFITREVLA